MRFARTHGRGARLTVTHGDGDETGAVGVVQLKLDAANLDERVEVRRHRTRVLPLSTRFLVEARLSPEAAAFAPYWGAYCGLGLQQYMRQLRAPAA